MATTGLNFNAPSGGGWCEEHYKNGTNCSFGFKVERLSGKVVRITFGLRNFDAGGYTYSYGYTSSTGNFVKISTTEHNLGAYNFTGVGNSWKDTGYYADVTITSGGASGNTATNISYSMEMNNSCYADGASGVITIPAGFIPATEYYTACGAPTSVSIDQSIIAPSGTFTVRWKGASNGTNNNVSGYRVYYTITSGGTAPTTSTTTYTDSTSTTTGNTEITLNITVSSATRGYKIVAGVVAKGQSSLGTSYWSGIKTGGSCIINTLPNAPTINKTSVIINSGSTVSATVTAGATNDSGQTASIKYATSTSGNKFDTTSSFSVSNVTNNTTYYFWTYDGLEYSSTYVTLSVTINSGAPALGTPTITATTATSANLSSGTYVPRMTLRFASMTQSTYGASIRDTGTIWVGIKYCTIGSSSYSTATVLNWVSVGNKTDYTVGSIDIINAIGTNKKWQLQAQLKDGLGKTSSVYYYPSENSYYYTAPVPTFSALYNRQSDSNVSNFTGYFYRYGRVYLTQDTNFTSITLTFTIGGATYTSSGTTTAVTIGGTAYSYYSFDLGAYKTGYQPGGTTLKLTKINLTDGTNNVQLTPNVTKTMLYEPILENLTGLPGTLKPYTASGNTSISVGVKALTNDNKTSYGLTSLAVIQFQMVNGNKVLDIANGSQGTISTSTLTISSIDTSSLYSVASNPLSFTNQHSLYNYYLRVKVSNDFGYSQTLDVKRNIDFRESPTITGQYFRVSSSNIGITNLKIQQGMVINFAFTINSHNQGKINYQVSYSLDNSTWTDIKTGSYTFSADSTSRDRNTYNVAASSWTVPKITSTGDTYLRIYISNSTTGSTTYNATYTTSAIKRNKINSTSSCAIEATKSGTNLVVTVLSDTNSSNTSLQTGSNIQYTDSYECTIKADANATPSKQQGDPITVVGTGDTGWKPPTSPSFSFALNSAKFINVQLTVVRTITQQYNVNNSWVTVATTTQTITSNIYSFYDTIATVSYRQNHIGINNAYAFNSSDAVVIGALDVTRRVIRLIGVGAQKTATITLPSDSSNVALANFVIDCGSW